MPITLDLEERDKDLRKQLAFLKDKNAALKDKFKR